MPSDTVLAAPNSIEPAPHAETGEAASVQAETAATPRRPAPFGIQKRVKEWIRVLHRDPTEEARANDERRARLLDEINRAVADAPDDIPIKDLVAQLNRHNDD